MLARASGVTEGPSNRGNSDEGRNQTILDRGRTLLVLEQFQKLAHGLRSLVPREAEARLTCSPLRRMRAN